MWSQILKFVILKYLELKIPALQTKIARLYDKHENAQAKYYSLTNEDK